ncbi:threonine synthase, partial [Buchnera aphidicola]|nr:threonine synthase [Buchnera aphidicola]
KITSEKLQEILKMDFITRSTEILFYFIGNEISKEKLYLHVQKAFSFQKPLKKDITKNISCLELFHGPTLAFKDFGARFMAQMISLLNKHNESCTILTATSGDTGAAVAQAFYKMKNVKVVILYPKGKISTLQEKLFCTLGENIKTISINGSFDDCQKLVKEAFDDKTLKDSISLNSANSINISRLLAQICYYFEAFSLLSEEERKQLIISVPCGNFGNLTAGLLAKSLGLPIKSFIACTNENDTVPRFLNSGQWTPKKTVSTISNAMDISQPN